MLLNGFNRNNSFHRSESQIVKNLNESFIITYTQKVSRGPATADSENPWKLEL